MTPELQAYVNAWQNEAGYNVTFHDELGKKVENDPLLRTHRSFVITNEYGFGDTPFHYVWKMLVESMPTEFRFLEIGVFKGQVLSLVALLAKQFEKTAYIYGVTTLENTADVRCKYPPGDYLKWIKGIFEQFKLSMEHTCLLVGKSDNRAITRLVAGRQYDLVYIDGGHDYMDVCADITAYSETVLPGGFLIMDDSSNLLNIGSLWPGLEDVSEAVKVMLESNAKFTHRLACGHLRVFQRNT